MGTAKGDGYTVTPRDLELVVHAINCTRLPFELEYDRLSRRLGYKNAQSAKAAWNALKRKLDKVAEGAPVVPSLTIDPEPLRRLVDPKTESNSRSNKKGKQPAFDRSQESSEEDTKSESEEPQPSENRANKKRKLGCAIDNEGGVPMGGDPGPSVKMSRKSKATFMSTGKATSPVEEKRKKPRRQPVPSSTPSDTSDDSDVPFKPKTPRKKLKATLKHLSIEDRAKVGGKCKGKRTDKSVAELETEAFVAREKAFEGFGGRDEEDDEEPPPAYVKRESESG